MEQKTKLKNGTVRTDILFYICIFLIPVFIMMIHMALKSCYPFGDNTFLLGDAEAQYMQFYKMLFDIIEEHKSLLFNVDAGMGMDMYTNFWYYLSNPLTFVVLLFGRNRIELGMIAVMLTEVGLCGVTANYFFRHSAINKYEKGAINNMFCALCALSYALCDYIIAYQFSILWLPCLVLAPLVMLGIERLVYERKYRLYIISLFLCMIFNFYFSWFICVLSLVWYADCKKGGLKDNLKTFVKYAGASVLSAMLSAFVLIPCFFMITSKNDASGSSLSNVRWDSFGNIGDFLKGFLWGHEADISGSDMVVNNNYCGLFVIVLALSYLFNKHIGKVQKIKRIIILVLLCLSLNWAGSIYILHGFAVPIGFGSRFAFILYLMLIVTAFEGISHISELRLRYIGLIGIMLTGCFAIILVDNTELESVLCYMGSAMIIMYFIICMVLLRWGSITEKSFIINIVAVGCLEIIINPFAALSNGYSVSMEREAQVESFESGYKDITADTGERKASWMYDDVVLFCYSDTNLYSSAINGNVVNLFDELGLQYMKNGNCYVYRGSTPLTNMLFNVRYVMMNDYSVTSYGGYEKISDKLYESDDVSGFGYVLPYEAADWNTDYDNPFMVQNEFTDGVMGEGDIFEEYVPKDMNAYGQNCTIDAYDDNRILYTNVTFDSAESAVVALSFTADKDMDLYLYASDTNNSCYVIYIDGEETGYSFRESSGDMIHIGQIKSEQQVIVFLFSCSNPMETGEIEYSFYSYNEDTMNRVKAKAGESVFDIDVYEDTYISGTVDCKKDGILYISLPYYDGFTAYVDGKEQEIVMIGDAMIGIPVTAGEHEIELRYLPYGLIPGIIISLTGVAIIIVWGVLVKRKEKRKEKRNEN